MSLRKTGRNLSCRDSSISSPGSSKAGTPGPVSVCLAGCNKSVVSNQKGLQCDFCEHWCHLECDDRVSPKVYSEISRTPSEAILYMCKTCRTGNFKVSLDTGKCRQDIEMLETNVLTMVSENRDVANKLADTLLKINSAIEQSNSAVESLSIRTDKLEKSYTHSTQSLDTYKSESTKTWANVAKKLDENVEKMKQANRQQTENELRKRNCILHNITESENESTLALVKGIARDKCSIDPTKIVRSFRLGKKRENKPRPIKVVLVSEDEKWELVKRLNGDSDNKTNGVYCNLDLTESERNAEYQRRLKVRSLKEAEPTDSKNLFRIRRGKIFKVTEQGVWTEIKLAQA